MDNSYRSPFDGWTEDPDLQIPFEPDLNFFSPDLTPLLASDEVRRSVDAIGQREIMIHQLFAYLGFTVRLETEPVNEIAKLLSRPAFLPWLDPRRRADALHVYRDEGKHADWSHQLIESVERETGVRRLDIEPAFLQELDRIVGGEGSAIPDLVKLFFVVVSETLITGSLNRLPKDQTVQLAVRNLARAHARDEGRHHKYFSTLFAEVWPTLPYQLRVRIGIVLPSMLRAFLSPDRGYLLGVLRRRPDQFSEPERVVDELLASPGVASGMRASAAPSLRMFRDAKVFDDPIVAGAFASNQFLTDDPAA